MVVVEGPLPALGSGNGGSLIPHCTLDVHPPPHLRSQLLWVYAEEGVAVEAGGLRGLP